MQTTKDQFFAALTDAGMPPVPKEFSVVPLPQIIPQGILLKIETFIRVFEQVTTRPRWQEAVVATAPEIAKHKRSEVCFFSAWDFHLPPYQSPQVIEFNDNGSGLLFAGLINELYYQFYNLSTNTALQPPVSCEKLAERIIHYVGQEARAFFGQWPSGLFLILENAEVLRAGKFQRELIMLRDLFRDQGWQSDIGAPGETDWDGQQLFWKGQRVSFTVNRSTDFLWQGEAFCAVRDAYAAGKVYAAPNPFTYATRSNKRLLELLSSPNWDKELDIQPEERAILSAHIPETHWLYPENIGEIARRKEEFVFKPAQGFAAQGLLASTEVGRSRLRRMLKEGKKYVAQKKVLKSQLRGETPLWTDLRVWAYRGQILLLSGRASNRPDGLDLSPPGGWLPTYVASHQA